MREHGGEILSHNNALEFGRSHFHGALARCLLTRPQSGLLLELLQRWNQTAAKPVLPPVLLIEDEPAVMAYVRAALGEAVIQLSPPESGAEALQILRSGEFMERGFRHAHSRRRRWSSSAHAWIAANRP